MRKVALVASASSLPIDYDMPLLLPACREAGLQAEVCDWEDSTIVWSEYDAAVLRCPWNYVDRLPKFLDWCDHVSRATHLFNPPSVARWNLNKYYLADLAARGVPTVPTSFVEPGQDTERSWKAFLGAHSLASEVVIKPTVGAYSKGVQRFAREREVEAVAYLSKLIEAGHHVILQPYLDAIDTHGETDLTYFDGVYSHAIRKGAMLMPDGTVHVPTQDFRAARVADEAERRIASAALAAAASCLRLDRPLLYARVDLIKGYDGQPLVLELEVCEPSLNLPLSEEGARRFAEAITSRVG